MNFNIFMKHQSEYNETLFLRILDYHPKQWKALETEIFNTAILPITQYMTLGIDTDTIKVRIAWSIWISKDWYTLSLKSISFSQIGTIRSLLILNISLPLLSLNALPIELERFALSWNWIPLLNASIREHLLS